MGDGVTPAQRVTVTRLLVYTPHELAQAALEQLRELCDEAPVSHEGAVMLARYEAARAHAAAMVELLPLPDTDDEGT